MKLSYFSMLLCASITVAGPALNPASTGNVTATVAAPANPTSVSATANRQAATPGLMNGPAEAVDGLLGGLAGAGNGQAGAASEEAAAPGLMNGLTKTADDIGGLVGGMEDKWSNAGGLLGTILPGLSGLTDQPATANGQPPTPGSTTGQTANPNNLTCGSTGAGDGQAGGGSGQTTVDLDQLIAFLRNLFAGLDGQTGAAAIQLLTLLVNLFSRLIGQL